MRIRPSELCTDREFIRRVYLDVLGVLPTPDEVQRIPGGFAGRLAATTSSTRLLVRPEFYDFWALKFADVLRSNGRLIQTKGAYVFHRWIRECLERNVPMDQIGPRTVDVRRDRPSRIPPQTITASAATPNRPSRPRPSSSWACAFSAPSAITIPSSAGRRTTTTASPPSSRRSAARRAIFPTRKSSTPPDPATSTSRERAARWSQRHWAARCSTTRRPKTGGSAWRAWLASPGNPFFAKSLVNRIWFHLIGRGIVEPVDDFRDSNPSSNDELLDGLAADFVKNGYDLKKLIRSILHSRTYQLSATTNPLNVDDSLYFSHAQTRLLPAEVLLDAISTVTGTTTSFNGLPRGARATQIPDGKMDNPFLKTFGRPARELACECERESDSNLSQALQLIGGATVNGKLRDDNGRMAQLAKSGKSPEQSHARALHGRPLPRPEPDRAGRRHQAPHRGQRLAPGRRRPRVGC